MTDFCYTCLSEDRELKPVDTCNIKSTLLECFKDSDCIVNVDNFQLCWECIAMIIKISKFKQQVLKAQKIRFKVQKKKSARLVSLTKLGVYTKEIYDAEYVNEDIGEQQTEGNTEITPTKKKTSKKRKERSRSKTKTKRKKAQDPNPATKESVPNIYNIYNYYNDSKLIKSKQETTKNVSEANDKGKGILEVIDLTKDPKLSAMPVVIIDNKQIKQELIDAYEADIENKSSKPAIFTNEVQNRPSVIKKVPTDNAERNWEDSNLKFTIVNLTEHEMLNNREIDRSERIYMKHFLKCESCVIGFADKTELDKHNKEAHSKLIGKYACPICATRFNKESLLTQHEKTHYFSFKCRQCDFEHHRRYVIEMHVVKEHDLTPSPVCAACDTEFGTQQRLNAHFEKAHKERMKCNQCAQSFDTVERLRDHATSHKEQDEVIEIFPCHQCQGIFEGKEAYRAHVQCVHKFLARHAYCEQCDLQFDSMKKFKHHVSEHSLFDQLKFDLPSGSSDDTLASDMKRVHRMLSHTCGLCKKGFSDEMRLNVHIQQKHPQVVTTESPKDTICTGIYDLCPSPSSPHQDASSTGEDQSEVIETATEKSCPICSEGFFTSIELLDHIRTHKAEKHFKCDICDKSFVSKMMLRKHVRSHVWD